MLPQPLPPPLPAERVQWVPPFSHVGVDHTGSYVIKDPQGRKTKAYICLFVCATTRAVHLEVVENLTTSSFMMCLRRLAATKGMPTLILLDNHRTFIAGETTSTERDPRVADGGTPRRVASPRATSNIQIRSRGPNEEVRDHVIHAVTTASQATSPGEVNCGWRSE